MPFTSADLAALDEAIKLGASEVRFQDRTVRFQNMAAMLQARTAILGELGQPGMIRQIQVYTDKGVR